VLGLGLLFLSGAGAGHGGPIRWLDLCGFVAFYSAIAGAIGAGLGALVGAVVGALKGAARARGGSASDPPR